MKDNRKFAEHIVEYLAHNNGLEIWIGSDAGWDGAVNDIENAIKEWETKESKGEETCQN